MELGLSQEQVALRADIDRNHYQLMESARSDRRSNRAVNPRFFTLLKLANALEMPVEELLHPFPDPTVFKSNAARCSDCADVRPAANPPHDEAGKRKAGPS